LKVNKKKNHNPQFSTNLMLKNKIEINQLKKDTKKQPTLTQTNQLNSRPVSQNQDNFIKRE
jgi:hypothetical protein